MSWTGDGAQVTFRDNYAHAAWACMPPKDAFYAVTKPALCSFPLP